MWTKSVEGRNIYFIELGGNKSTTIIFAVVHGNESLSGELALQLAEYLHDDYQEPLESKVIIVPVVNPDGLIRGQRTNANRVDIDRNFPTKTWTENFESEDQFPGKYPASEPETQAVIEMIIKYKPDRIISIHTPLKMINYDGPAKELADRMSQLNGYPVKQNIGNTSPGSLGTYTGIERAIPTIRLDLPNGSLQNIWEQNREALLAVIR